MTERAHSSHMGPDRLTELQVQDACLAQVLDLGACLAHLSLAGPLPAAGAPLEDGVGPVAHLAVARTLQREEGGGVIESQTEI